MDTWLKRALRHAIRTDDPALVKAIEASYSADLFRAPDDQPQRRATCRTPVQIDGELWIMVSGYYGADVRQYDLYRIQPGTGLTHEQATAAHYADREQRKPPGTPSRPYYQGMQVEHDGVSYVLDGEQRRYWTLTKEVSRAS